jgi:RHS repeat-associated protein
VHAHFFYGVFGEVLHSYNTGEAEWLRRFNGKEQDQLDGLSYYGYRFYDPLTLQWTSSDPLYRLVLDINLEASQRLNLYAFVNGNPLRYRDFDGLAGEVHSDENHCEGGTSTTCNRDEAKRLGLTGTARSQYVKASKSGSKAQLGVFGAFIDKLNKYKLIFDYGFVFANQNLKGAFDRAKQVSPRFAKDATEMQMDPRTFVLVSESNEPLVIALGGGLSDGDFYKDIKVGGKSAFIGSVKINIGVAYESQLSYGVIPSFAAIVAHELGHVLGAYRGEAGTMDKKRSGHVAIGYENEVNRATFSGERRDPWPFGSGH